MLNHDELSGADLSNGLVVLIIVVGWTLMVVAMMLPTSLPLVALFYRLTRQRQTRCYSCVCCLLGISACGLSLAW